MKNIENIGNKGFTLVQVIVSIAVFTILLLAMNRLFVSIYREQKVSVAMMERTNRANRLLAIMGEELRQANRSKAGNYLLGTAGAGDIVFYSDIDADGEMEKVRYYLDGTELKKTVIEPGALPYYSDAGTTEVVGSQVVNGTIPIFTYYDGGYLTSGTPLTAPVLPADVQVVGVHLEFDTPDTLSAYNLAVDTKIRLRNVRE